MGLFAKNLLSSELAQSIAVIGALFILPFLNQRRLSRNLASLRRLQNRARTNSQLNGKTALLLVIGAFVVTKLAMIPSLNRIPALIVAAIMILGIVSSVRHFLKETHARSKSLAESPWLHVVLWERQLILLLCIPIFAARLVSLVGALSLGTTATPEYNLVYPVLGVILLLALRPNKDAFIGWCPKCKSPTPIAFVEYGTCPRCDREFLG